MQKQSQFEELIANVTEMQRQIKTMQDDLQSLRGASEDHGVKKGQVIE